MKATIPQNLDLIKNLFALLEAHRPVFKQNRIYLRVFALVMAEIFTFARHTMTQLLMSLGLNEEDWSAWYRLFSAERFDADQVAAVLLAQTLKHVAEDQLYVVAGDGTQTPRSSAKMEGVGWLRNMRTPAFRIGIHHAQRWFNGSWLMPPENGYSRAMPLRWLPAFTEKSKPQAHEPCKEWEAALIFLTWLLAQFVRLGRTTQKLLMVVDGRYDTLNLWQRLPSGAILLARSAKNRVLKHLPASDAHGNRKYGERARAPQAWLRERKGWKKIKLTIRGRERKLRYRVEGPYLRDKAPDVPLFLIVVSGQVYSKRGRRKHRQAAFYLVNALQNEAGEWVLPLPIETLLFWAWQRWEIEVCHRELKSNFGLGHKQCWNPQAAVRSVQWSAWVYSLLLLAGYRTWGLCGAPDVPTRWWRGSGRWSLNTLWRAYRAALWGSHEFRPLYRVTPDNMARNEAFCQGLFNAVYASARS